MLSPRFLFALALVASAAAVPISDRSILEFFTPRLGFLSSPWSSFYNTFFTPLWHFGHVSSSSVIVKTDENKFEIVMKLNGYNKDEIKVNVNGRYLNLHGRHESKKEGQNSFASQFYNTFTIPENASADDVTASLTSDNYLIVSAPIKSGVKNEDVKKEITIAETGTPYLAEKPDTTTDKNHKETVEKVEEKEEDNTIPHGQ